MSTTTIAALNEAHGLTLVTDYADDFEIPVTSGLQRQGDVIVIPNDGAKASTPVPAAGCPVVRGEAGGNTHAIYTDTGSGVLCDTRTPAPGDLVVATLFVPEGASAFLGHPEHAYTGIGPGRYEIRRQQEQAESLRIVQD